MRIVLYFLAACLLSFTPNQEEMTLRISKNDKVYFCDETQVNVQFSSQKIKLETPKVNLELVIIARDVGETKAWIATDENGNRYIVDNIVSEDKKARGYIFVPEIDYLFTYTIADRELCQ